MYAVGSRPTTRRLCQIQRGKEVMIFTRRFGALAARPQFQDSPELEQELNLDIDIDLTHHDERVEQHVEESAA
jgi:hypothetical protein